MAMTISLWAVGMIWDKLVNPDSVKEPRVCSTSGVLRKHQDEGQKVFTLGGTSAGDSREWQKHIQDSYKYIWSSFLRVEDSATWVLMEKKKKGAEFGFI